MVKIISWNANSIRNVFSKHETSFKEFIELEDADVICIQETRCLAEAKDGFPSWFKGRYPFGEICAAQKKGYSGVGTFSKVAPVSCKNEFVPWTMHSTDPDPNTDANEIIPFEGRSQLCDFGSFQVANLYVPNSKPDLGRLSFRVKSWEPSVVAAMKTRISTDSSQASQAQAPLVIVADFNVVPGKLDSYKHLGPKVACATIEEKAAFANLQKELGFVDGFRELYPLKQEYTWFSNFGKSREKGNGLRIDHVLSMPGVLKEVRICKDVNGSDHVPLVIEF